ncbi:MAG: hypothetical protein ACOC3H_01740 [bacterium]
MQLPTRKNAVPLHIRGRTNRISCRLPPIARIGLALSLALSAVGCDQLFDAAGLSAPIAYVSVRTVAGDRGALHRRAGLHYTLENVSDREIAGTRIAFDLYDEAGRPYPASGENSFEVNVDAPIEPGGRASFCTSLDRVVCEPLALSVARFRAERVRLADGSVWRNPGSHCYEEE